jgi:CubicO group peptidase (beta-lactamase class C family)
MSFFPEYCLSGKDPRKQEITLYNLLTMTAGIDWNDNPDVDNLDTNQNWLKFMIEKP